MEKLELKEVLKFEDVKKSIAGNLGLEDKVIEEVIELSITSISNNRSVVKMTVDGELIEFNNSLYRDENKGLYLFESRAFKTSDDSMLGAYLEVYNEDGVIVDEEIDDVWSYADWKKFN